MERKFFGFASAASDYKMSIGSISSVVI